MNANEIKRMIREEIRGLLSNELSGIIQQLVSKEVEIALNKKENQLENKKTFEIAVQKQIDAKLNPQIKNIVQYIEMKTVDESIVTEYRKKAAMQSNPEFGQYFTGPQQKIGKQISDSGANFPSNVPSKPIYYFE